MNRIWKLSNKEIDETEKVFEFLLNERKDFKECLKDVKTPEEKFAEIFNYFNFYLLGLCGCGAPDNTIEVIRDYLNIVKVNHERNFNEGEKLLKEIFDVNNVCLDPVLQFMAYTLDDKELTDHGNNISGAWITDLGEALLWCFNIYIKNN